MSKVCEFKREKWNLLRHFVFALCNGALYTVGMNTCLTCFDIGDGYNIFKEDTLMNFIAPRANTDV
jgi:hypothetical protein